jgi:hypothetical protein
VQEKGSEPSNLEKIPVSRRIEQELHEGYHQDSSHRQIEILEDKRIETFQVSKHRIDLDHLLEETHGEDRAPVGTLVHQGIDIPVDKRSGKSRSKNLT